MRSVLALVAPGLSRGAAGSASVLSGRWAVPSPVISAVCRGRGLSPGVVVVPWS